MKVLICGDRHWNNYSSILNIVQRLKKAYGNIKIVQGGCSGADIIAKKAAIECGLEYAEYPANWSKYGKRAGPLRNQQMLDEENPDMVIAFHPNINQSKGSRDMITRAKQVGIQTYIFDK
ncbi:MAG TPA: DUF2493 domain-containing protein [Epulopiscium sp.]|nr:DUF2493 domain-containing protein [Candidatus Epulonipiscium sp.]